VEKFSAVKKWNLSLSPHYEIYYSTLDIQPQQGGNGERRNIHTNA